MKTTQFLVMTLSSISVSGVAKAHPAPAVQIQITSNVPVACMVQLVAPQHSAETQELKQENREQANGIEAKETEHLRVKNLSRAFLEQSYREAILNSKNYAPFMRTRQNEGTYLRLSQPEIPDDEK